MTDSSPLRVDVDDGIALLTLNRPERRNAVSRALADDLDATITRLDDDDDVRVLIITGAGDQAFCAGADLKERAGMSEAQVRAFVSGLQRSLDRIDALPKPVIAAINGFALGGGLELALACDIRVASETASMGLTEVRLAIIPGAGGTQRLPRIVGTAYAKELILTGRRIGAAEAERIGLVSRVSAPTTLLDDARAIAAEITLGGPLAIAQAKFAINHGMQVDLATGLAIERKAYEVLIPTEDRVEALHAFREKRRPDFKGR